MDFNRWIPTQSGKYSNVFKEKTYGASGAMYEPDDYMICI